MSGAEGKPVLLTAQEAYDLGRMGTAEMLMFLKERGLIAPEPVDTLKAEADRLLEEWPDNQEAYWLALTALRRGMELAPAARLTREMVREAVSALLWHNLTARDITVIHDRLHTALTQQMEGRDG